MAVIFAQSSACKDGVVERDGMLNWAVRIGQMQWKIVFKTMDSTYESKQYLV